MKWIQVSEGEFISRDCQCLIKRHSQRDGDTWLFWRLEERADDYDWIYAESFDDLEDAQDSVSESILV